MTDPPDLVVRDAYLRSRDEVLDVAVADGRIERLAASVDRTGEAELDAAGNLVSPGFVDAHVHLDQAFARRGGRRPAFNDESFDMGRSLAHSESYFRETDPETIEEAVVAAGRRAVANGVLHCRTHAYVDGAVGTKSVEAVAAARERLAGLLDLEVVAFPQQGVLAGGTADVLAESAGAGADLVGGLDPASVNRDVAGTIETWLSVASTLDVGLDVHLHDPGSLGTYTLDRLLAAVRDHGYEGRVTASHCYALAGAASDRDVWLPDGSLDALLERMRAAGVDVVTCYLSTDPGMPVRRLQRAGVAVAHGSDQVQDQWLVHGTVDPLEAALVQSLRLGADYEYATNEGLDRLWRLVTAGGAAVLGLDDYGVVPGTPADLVVHDAASPQWAIVEGGPPRYVVKGGRVVAADGEVVG